MATDPVMQKKQSLSRVIVRTLLKVREAHGTLGREWQQSCNLRRRFSAHDFGYDKNHSTHILLLTCIFYPSDMVCIRSYKPVSKLFANTSIWLSDGSKFKTSKYIGP
jgi:hypothetical protein